MSVLLGRWEGKVWREEVGGEGVEGEVDGEGVEGETCLQVWMRDSPAVLGCSTEVTEATIVERQITSLLVHELV